MLCLLFLSPVITGQHSEEAEDVRRIPEQGLHSGSVALWDLDVGSSVIGIGRMNFGLWWHDESSGAQTEGLTLCCFWRNGGVKGPFLLFSFFPVPAHAFGTRIKGGAGTHWYSQWLLLSKDPVHRAGSSAEIWICHKVQLHPPREQVRSFFLQEYSAGVH